MCFTDDHDDLELRGHPKGLRAVLMEHKSIWDKYTDMCKWHGAKVVGRCAECKKAQVCKDAEHQVKLVEEMEDNITLEDMKLIEEQVLVAEDEWCCMYWVLSL